MYLNALYFFALFVSLDWRGYDNICMSLVLLVKTSFIYYFHCLYGPGIHSMR